MVEMVKDVAAWRDKWFSGVKMKPEPDALEYEMNNLGRTIWGVCWKDNIEKKGERKRESKCVAMHRSIKWSECVNHPREKKE